MSELTACNYCSLERLKRVYNKRPTYANQEGLRTYITLVPTRQWIEAYVVTTDACGVERSPRQRIAMFLELTTVCAC